MSVVELEHFKQELGDIAHQLAMEGHRLEHCHDIWAGTIDIQRTLGGGREIGSLESHTISLIAGGDEQALTMEGLSRAAEKVWVALKKAGEKVSTMLKKFFEWLAGDKGQRAKQSLQETSVSLARARKSGVREVKSDVSEKDLDEVTKEIAELLSAQEEHFKKEKERQQQIDKFIKMMDKGQFKNDAMDMARKMFDREQTNESISLEGRLMPTTKLVDKVKSARDAFAQKVSKSATRKFDVKIKTIENHIDRAMDFHERIREMADTAKQINEDHQESRKKMDKVVDTAREEITGELLRTVNIKLDQALANALTNSGMLNLSLMKTLSNTSASNHGDDDKK